MPSPLMFAAAVLAGVPNLPPPAAAPAREGSRRPGPVRDRAPPDRITIPF